MPIKILVVDDDRSKLAKVIKLLEETGVQRECIEVAQTGSEARRFLMALRYDLLILDVALPMRAEDSPDRKGGIKLLDEVVERDIYKKPDNVVGLTGFDDLHKEVMDKFHSRLWSLEYYDPSDYSWIDRVKAKVRYIISQSSQVEHISYGADVCIIAALHSPELTAMRSVKWNWNVPESLDEIGYCYEARFESKGKSKRAIAAAAPRMGMVATAILSMKMIVKFRPRLLIMMGICAGVKATCAIGDVLVADPAWDWQMGKYVNGKFAFAPDQIDIPTAISERFIQLNDDKNLWFNIYQSFSGSKPSSLPTLKIGPVPSGSSVLADAQVLKDIKTQHRKMLGLDMELYGMYAAARDCSPPRPITFGIKSVSDYADSRKGDMYQSYAAHVSAHTLVAFCERYTDDFCDTGRFL